MVYLATHGIGFSLAFTNKMPFGIEVDLAQNDQFKLTMLVGFLMVSLFCFYDFKLILFVQTPVFLLGTLIQAKSDLDNYEQFGLAKPISINLALTRAIILAVPVILSSYLHQK